MHPIAADTVNPPKWMDVNFFAKVLRKSNNDDTVVVNSILVAPGAKPEEHLASAIYRVLVDYSRRTQKGEKISLIVKTVVDVNVEQGSLFTDNKNFLTEMQMYTMTVANMQRLLTQAGDNDELAPRMLYAAKAPAFVLVFEDLMIRNFEMSETLLDFEGTKLVLQKLAKWHATSYQLGQEEDGIKNYSSFDPMALSYYANAFFVLSKAVRSWPGDNEQLAEKLERYGETVGEEIGKLYNTSGGFSVLNHGDFDIKNIMVKLAGSTVKDLVFIDFQACSWGTPAIDLLRTLYLVASDETRTQYRDELIVFYYQQFVNTLKNIGFMGKTPSLLDLQVELLKFGYWELILVVSVLPLMYVDFAKTRIDAAMKSGLNSNETDFMNEVYSSQVFEQILMDALPKMMQKGYLN